MGELAEQALYCFGQHAGRRVEAFTADAACVGTGHFNGLARRGIGVEWFDYGPYREYPQLWGAFEHRVSILDLLFHGGADAARLARRA